MSSFFSDKESENLVRTIAEIEKNTIGELKIHVEDTCASSPYDRAVEVFQKLGMYKTREKTGVLIYLSTEDRKIAVIGDRGIHEKLGPLFWTEIISEMKRRFASESIWKGVQYGLSEIGKELIHHFPEKNKPVDELSNEISYGHI